MHVKILSVILGLVGIGALPASGQERAITESGDTVVLKPDSTLLASKHYNLDSNFAHPENPDTVVKKPDEAADYTSGSPKRYILWYNDETWQKIPPEQIHKKADVALKMKDRLAYASIIYRPFQLDADKMQRVHFSRMKRAVNNAQQLSKGYRVVNGDTMATSKVKYKRSSLTYIYCSQYHSNSHGSVQLYTFTAKRFYPELKNRIHKLLNGLVIND